MDAIPQGVAFFVCEVFTLQFGLKGDLWGKLLIFGLTLGIAVPNFQWIGHHDLMTVAHGFVVIEHGVGDIAGHFHPALP